MASGNEAVTVEQLARALGVPAPAPPLPSGYTRLEYIEGTGTQYIDTGVKPDSTMRVKASFDPVSTRDTMIFGARPRSNGSDLFVLLHAASPDSLRDDWGNEKTSVPLLSVPISGTIDVDKNANKTTFNGSYVVTHGESTWSGTNNLYAFACNEDGVARKLTKARMRSFDIWKSGEKVRGLVPARRDSDGAVGMYDTVSKQFFGNSGSGAFKAGPEVATAAVDGADGAVVTLRQFKVASSKLGGGGEQPPAGLKETVIYEGSGSGRLYFQRELTAIRKVVVEYRLQTNLSELYNFTYEGEPTGYHTSSDGRVRIYFTVVGASPTLIVEDVTGTHLVRFERITIYEQQ